MKVRVTKEGFMFGSTQKVGTVITLAKDSHFSKNWMEKIEEIKIEEEEVKTKEPDNEPEKVKEKPKAPEKTKNPKK